MFKDHHKASIETTWGDYPHFMRTWRAEEKDGELEFLRTKLQKQRNSTKKLNKHYVQRCKKLQQEKGSIEEKIRDLKTQAKSITQEVSTQTCVHVIHFNITESRKLYEPDSRVIHRGGAQGCVEYAMKIWVRDEASLIL